MCCANWIMSIAAVVIFVLAIWPGILGAVAAEWIIAIAAIVILVVSWTGCKCKYCEKMEKPAAKKITKK